MPELTAERLITLLNLEPLPVEGGYFRQTYHAGETIEPPALPARYRRPKALGSAIYYLLHGDHFSALHRLLTDEIYHFYLGDPVEMLLLYPDGASEVMSLGPDLEAGQRVQLVVPRGVWQGARLRVGGAWALLGATLAPAWDEGDFVLGRREELEQHYPDRAEMIRALTRFQDSPKNKLPRP